jgi:hypothetical protein
MMRARLLALAENRTRLVARAQAEREAIAGLLAPADAASSMALAAYNLARRVLQEAREHPLIAIAGGVALAVMRPRRAIAWIAKGWSLYRMYRSVLPVWQRFAAGAAAHGGRPRQPS